MYIPHILLHVTDKLSRFISVTYADHTSNEQHSEMLCIETKTGFALNNEVVRESAPYVLIQFYIREQCDVSTVSSAEGVVWGAP